MIILCFEGNVGKELNQLISLMNNEEADQEKDAKKSS